MKTLCCRVVLVPLLHCLVVLSFGTNQACGQVGENQVVLSEFYEELYLIDANASTAIDILDSPTGASPFGQLVEVLNENTIIQSNFSDLYRYDPVTQTSSLWTSLPFRPLEIARDLNGDLITIGTSGVWEIDGITGDIRRIHDATFFSPTDAVVSAEGIIFVTEFFESLGFVRPGGGYTPIGNLRPNKFSHLDLGLDGNLYLSSRTDGEFWRVDPLTGQADLLGANVFTSMDDFKVEASGSILFSGNDDVTDGVFRFDPITGQTTTIVDGANFNSGFWSGLDLDIYSPSFRTASVVPEPVSLLLTSGAMIGMALSPVWRFRVRVTSQLE